VVDTVVPTLTISTENDSAFLLDDLGLVEGSASDAGSGVARIEVHYELVTGADRGTRHASCPACPSGSVSWSDVPAMMPGYYRAEVTAVDRAGNRSATASITFFQANP